MMLLGMPYPDFISNFMACVDWLLSTLISPTVCTFLMCGSNFYLLLAMAGMGRGIWSMEVGELFHWLQVGLVISNCRSIHPNYAKLLTSVQGFLNLLEHIVLAALLLDHRSCWGKHLLMLSKGLAKSFYCHTSLLSRGRSIQSRPWFTF